LVRCEKCYEETGQEIWFNRVAGMHLKSHGMELSEYEEKYPGCPSYSEEFSNSLSEAMTGMVYSEERNRKISEALTDRVFTEEHCRNLSESHKGMVFSEESKENIRRGQLEFWASEEGQAVIAQREEDRLGDEEWGRHISEGLTGLIHSDEWRQHMSEARTDPENFERWNSNISKSLMGHSTSEETVEKIKAGLEVYWSDPEVREEHSRKCREYWDSEVGQLTRARISENRETDTEWADSISRAKIGSKLSDEHKESISKGGKAYWATEEGKAGRSSSFKDGGRYTFNEEEELLYLTLVDCFPGEYSFVGDGKEYIGSKCPDFININGKSKVIEYFGSHWHTQYHEYSRSECLREYGYETLVIWDWQLDKASESFEEFCKLMQRISDFTYSKATIVRSI